MIKTFENFNISASVGDLVELKMIPDYFEGNNSGNLYAKILKMGRNRDGSPYSGSNYEEVIIQFELTNGQTLWGTVYLIRKKLTQKQIKDYEVKISANKYNL